MAKRPTFASVTDVRCRCGYLRRAAEEPLSPIVFDQTTGEYQFQYHCGDSKGWSTLMIYHCPFCGGAAPRSKRPSLFHVIPLEEQERLTAMLIGIRTIRSALRRLGKPQIDNPRGTMVQTPARGGAAPRTLWYRTLHYAKLSTVADVWFTQQSSGRAVWHLQGKVKRPRKSGNRAQGPRIKKG